MFCFNLNILIFNLTFVCHRVSIISASFYAITSLALGQLHPVKPWWRHQMETFSALLALCAENSPVTSEFPSQRPVTRIFDVFTRGQFWPSGIVVACICVCVRVCQFVCQSLACLHDNPEPVQARITKFRPKMQKTLVKVPIVFWGNWPWPSRSNLT